MQTLMTPRALERAQRGAEFLDTHEPNWEQRIVPQELRMSSATSCIVGQVFGEFERGSIALYERQFGVQLQPLDPEIREWASEHGFFSRGGDPTYLELRAAWEHILITRALVRDRATEGELATSGD